MNVWDSLFFPTNTPKPKDILIMEVNRAKGNNWKYHEINPEVKEMFLSSSWLCDELEFAVIQF